MIKKPGVAIGGLDDHLSHMGETRIFFREGFDLYRKTGESFCTPGAPSKQSAPASGCWPRNACRIQGPRPAVCLNWQPFLRPYPLGSVLYAVPEALLSRFTHARPHKLARLIILKYLLGAHLLLWALFRATVASPTGSTADSHDRTRWLARGLFTLAYIEVILWSLEGFYDAVAVALVVIGALFLCRREPGNAWLALGGSLFLHYRALWYLPLLGMAAIGLVNRSAWSRPLATGAKVAAGFAMILLAAFTFILIYRGLNKFPDTNPVHWRRFLAPPSVEWDFLAPILMILSYLAIAKHWRLLVTMSWQLFMVSQTPQVMGWHVLFLLPMFAVARLERGIGPKVATAVWFATTVLVVFHSPFPHLTRLITNLASAVEAGVSGA